MCGIAGIADLRGVREIDPAVLERMGSAIAHRGPDESGSFRRPGLGLTARRLSIVGLNDGRQPIFNEDRTVAVVFNGEIFDYPERRAELEARGHRFATSCDTEVLAHLWEDEGEAMLDGLRGQFAFALFDATRRVLILARDRVGIVPLHWTRRGDFLYFGSEIKALLASGAVAAEADPRGIDHVFTFLSLGARRTAFRDVHAIAPGSFLRVQFRSGGAPAEVHEQAWWDVSFPDQGDEYDRRSEPELVEELGGLFDEAVRIRLRADVPVVGYLSGGVDSTSVMWSATRALGRPIPSFTIRIPDRTLDETDRALLAADRLGSPATVVVCDGETIRRVYPNLIEAAEAPVVDTSCAAMYRQAEEVRRQGYKVVLTGEGADDGLAGYPWLKAGKALGLLDYTGLRASNLLRRLATIISGRHAQWPRMLRFQDRLGGPNGLLDFYCLVCLTRHWFYSPRMHEQLGESSAFDDLPLNEAALKRWHPLNRALYLGYKTLLPGLLMSQKGDRPAMHNSIETRHPFLDGTLIDFCSRLPPRLKLRGLRRDKHLLRLYAAGKLPASIAERRKAMFRAPLAATFLSDPPAYVDELLSDESLRATGYFAPERVQLFRRTWSRIRNPLRRLVVEMGLTGVMATQLWHHTFLGGGLCGLPTWSPAPDRLSRPKPEPLHLAATVEIAGDGVVAARPARID